MASVERASSEVLHGNLAEADHDKADECKDDGGEERLPVQELDQSVPAASAPMYRIRAEWAGCANSMAGECVGECARCHGVQRCGERTR